MIGFPKTLSSMRDYENIRKDFPKEKWLQQWKLLLQSAYMWNPMGTVSSVEAGIVDDTHKVEKSTDENKTVYIQYELVFNESCKLKRLGFSVDYVSDTIKSAESE